MIYWHHQNKSYRHKYWLHFWVIVVRAHAQTEAVSVQLLAWLTVTLAPLGDVFSNFRFVLINFLLHRNCAQGLCSSFAQYFTALEEAIAYR